MRFVVIGLAVTSVVALAACSTDSTDPGTVIPVTGIGDGERGGGGTDGGGDRDYGAPDSMAGEGSASDDPSVDGGGSTVGTGTGMAEPGTLTAGVWDDNRNFSRFLEFRSTLHQGEVEGLPPFAVEEHEAANEEHAELARGKGTLDVALVIDTTGSMGDEMVYLQAEFIALTRAIEARFPGAAQRWSLVVYRDEGDEYVVRWFDFRSDLEELREHLAAQQASGGGDFPEAPDQALES